MRRLVGKRAGRAGWGLCFLSGINEEFTKYNKKPGSFSELNISDVLIKVAAFGDVGDSLMASARVDPYYNQATGWASCTTACQLLSALLFSLDNVFFPMGGRDGSFLIGLGSSSLVKAFAYEERRSVDEQRKLST